jgi:CheY-like chemotaxis protein
MLLSFVNDIIQFAQQQLQPLTVLDSSSPQLLEYPATATLVRSATTTLETLERQRRVFDHRASSAPQVQGGMILVVDDNPTHCDLLSRLLTRQGYTVTTATNARQALHQLKAIAYDLILLNAIAPEMDGLELLQQLKQDDRFKHIPAIVISAQDLAQQVQLLQSNIDFRSERLLRRQTLRERQRGQQQRLVAEIPATEQFQQLQQRTKSSSDIENLYHSSLYPSLHPAPPNRDRASQRS